MINRWISNEVEDNKHRLKNNNVVTGKKGSGKSTLPYALLNKDLIHGKTLIVTNITNSKTRINTFETVKQKKAKNGEWVFDKFEQAKGSCEIIPYHVLKRELEINKDYLNSFDNIFFDDLHIFYLNIGEDSKEFDKFIIEILKKDDGVVKFFTVQELSQFTDIAYKLGIDMKDISFIDIFKNQKNDPNLQRKLAIMHFNAMF